MVGRHLCKGKAHPESRVAVDYLGLGLENALIPDNPQPYLRPLGERIERVNVAAPQTNFGGAR